MGELLQKLGVDKWLLLSQAVNFLVLLWVMKKFAYGPLVEIMNKRRERIEEGLMKAEEADTRLREAEDTAQMKRKEAEDEAMAILRATEEKAKKTETHLLDEARKKEAALLANAELAAKAKGDEAAAKVRAEAAILVKQALVKTVGLAPNAVDEALIHQAVEAAARGGAGSQA